MLFLKPCPNAERTTSSKTFVNETVPVAGVEPPETLTVTEPLVL